ncbi:MAG: hypothetical protein M1833_000969 [Piccolia ochrophora]|nr:MAG: hypothetical protein M1833_000969 [Piccolia ochrophora]
MVLDEASPTASGDFDSDSPSSNDYPSSDPFGVARFTEYIQEQANPIPLFGPLSGWNKRRTTQVLTSDISLASRIVDRPLTMDEGKAIIELNGGAYQKTGFGAAIGLGVAWFAAKRRERIAAQSFRDGKIARGIPFFKPDQLFTLRGPKALSAWALVRLTIYGYFGLKIGGAMTGAYGLTVSQRKLQADSRLEDFRRVRDSVPQARRQQIVLEQQFGKKRPGTRPTGWGGDQPQADEHSDGRLQKGEDGMLSDEQAGATQAQNRAAWRRDQAPADDVQAQDNNTNDQDPFGNNYNDNSPTASSTGSSSSSNDEVRSTWDQIRRGAGASPSTPPPQRSPWPSNRSSPPQQPSRQSAWTRNRGQSTQDEQQEGSTVGDSFSFSKTDEDRQLAKSEAQKAFDESVERERKGGDFSGRGNEGGKKW